MNWEGSENSGLFRALSWKEWGITWKTSS